jgi:hypothetical protein
MKSFDELLPNILQYAPGCAVPAAYVAIREAATEFCERTRLWRYADDFDMTEDDAEGISTPYGSVLHEIELVQFDGDDLGARTVSWLDAFERGWRTGGLTGKPQYVTQTEPNTLRVVPFQAGHVNIFVWLKPSVDAEELPDFLIDQYRETIAHGALARILAVPSKPYSNPQLATAFIQSWVSRLDEFSSMGATGQQRARPRTRASFF